MAALEDNQHRHGMDYYKDVQEQFRKATNSIQMDIERWYQRLADNNDISYAAARRLLKKNELEEFHWSVEQYIKAGEENAVNQPWMKELENASARHHISYLEAMKLQAQQHAELLSVEFEGGMTDFLHKSYADGYYHMAYEISKGTGVGANIARLDGRRIDTVIKKPWARDGANFSDRIWTNKEKLVNNLHTELTQSIIRGDPPQKAIEGLAKTMNVSKAQAGRLIMTESAALSSAASQDIYKELGVEQYEILATLDSLTSEICRNLDGKVFDMKDYAVGDTAPPFHPHCRTATVPFFDDEFSAVEKRAARDEETGDTVYVDGQMNYREWENEHVKGIRPEPDKEVNVPESLKITGSASDDVRKVFERETAMLPSAHRDIVESTIKEVKVDPADNSRYDRTKGILYLAEELEEGEAIHEMAHALETKMGVWSDPKFMNALKSTLGEENPLFYVLDDADTFTKPIQRLNMADVLVSNYQGRIYEEVGALDDNWEFNYYSLGDFFSEAYKEYVLRPDRLKEKQPLMFDYIKEMVK